MNLTLIRHAYLETCSLGYLFAGSLKLAVIADAWHPDPDGPGGQRKEPGKLESCAPDGMYTLAPHSGGTWKNVWALVNHALGIYRHAADIPAGQKYGRSEILIHSGNDDDDVIGCMAVGMRHGILNGRHWVYESREALDRLRSLLNSTTETHSLFIRPTAGTSETIA